MNKLAALLLVALSITAVACGDDDTGSTSSSGGGSSGNGTGNGSSGTGSGQSSTGSTSTSTNKFTCSLNGSCYECPSSQAVIDCAKKGGSEAGCTSADSSKCN